MAGNRRRKQDNSGAVSYTHLDVYKRQGVLWMEAGISSMRQE